MTKSLSDTIDVDSLAYIHRRQLVLDNPFAHISSLFFNEDLSDFKNLELTVNDYVDLGEAIVCEYCDYPINDHPVIADLPDGRSQVCSRFKGESHD